MKSVVKKNAFTIMELLVAMTLLVMLLGLSGMVFHTTVAAHRAAGATIDVTRTLNAVRGQLNADFQGLQKDAPLFIWFNAVDANGDTVPDTHYDAIHFFANGDFQTYKNQYQNASGVLKALSGNMARIYYGHANSVNLIANPAAAPDFMTTEILARRSHLLTAEPMIWSIPNLGMPPDYSIFPTSNFNSTLGYENLYEYNTISLTEWINTLNFSTANADYFLETVMFDTAAADGNISRPYVDIAKPDGLWNLFSQGVIQMQIQWAYTADDLTISETGFVPISAANYFAGIRWWPSVDPAGDESVLSDFSVMGNRYGVYLSLPNGTGAGNLSWNRVKPKATEMVAQNGSRRCRTQFAFFRQDFYPRALKFTLVLKDSNGVFADGKTFTHIVYLDN